MSRSGLVLVMIAAVLWATVGIATGLTPAHSRWPAEVLAFSRMALAGPLLLGVIFATHNAPVDMIRKMRLLDLARFAVSCAVFQICLFHSFPLIGVTATIFLNVTLRPVISMIWETITGHEQINVREVTAMTLAVAGLGLLSAGSFGGQGNRSWWFGVSICVIGSISFVIMSYALRKMATVVPTLVVIGVGLTFSAGVLFPAMLLAQPSGIVSLATLPHDVHTFALAAYLAVFPTAIGYICFCSGMSQCRTATAGLLAAMIEPTIAASLAAGLLGERFSGSEALGCLALTAAMLSLWLPQGMGITESLLWLMQYSRRRRQETRQR